jgi:hypothetical protein
MKRNEYHFLTVRATPRGRSFFAVPGQTLGRSPVPTDIIVTDRGGRSALRNARKEAKEGEIFYTTTLRRATGKFTADSVMPLSSTCDLFAPVARREYARLASPAPSCPWCGSAHTEHAVGTASGEDGYRCLDCGGGFDGDDLRREPMRRRISALLEGTDETRPLRCGITIGEDEACGLSSLELPEVVSAFQIPGEGTIWFHIYGDNDPETGKERYTAFDDLSLSDIRAIQSGLIEQQSAHTN